MKQRLTKLSKIMQKGYTLNSFKYSADIDWSKGGESIWKYQVTLSKAYDHKVGRASTFLKALEKALNQFNNSI